MTYQLPPEGYYVLRRRRPDVRGPAVCSLRVGELWDVTYREIPTVRELSDPIAGLPQTAAEWLANAELGEEVLDPLVLIVLTDRAEQMIEITNRLKDS